MLQISEHPWPFLLVAMIATHPTIVTSPRSRIQWMGPCHDVLSPEPTTRP